jgi:ABC-2 type transport system ATP-binding protein
MSILQTNALSKSFGDFIAVDCLNIQINKGDIFALLGPNGAGKTTAIKMLTTLLPPTSGTAYINGIEIQQDTNAIRRMIGYVPQLPSADGSLTGFENLLLFAKLYDIPRSDRNKRVSEAIEFMELNKAAHKLVKTYSGGMIRRLEIAQSTLHRPKILFLDEPTSGLDPIGRSIVWDHLTSLQKMYETTIVITTHLMEEVDKFCNEVALMAKGKLVAKGTPTKLKKQIGKQNATLDDVFIYYTSENLK